MDISELFKEESRNVGVCEETRVWVGEEWRAFGSGAWKSLSKADAFRYVKGFAPFSEVCVGEGCVVVVCDVRWKGSKGVAKVFEIVGDDMDVRDMGEGLHSMTHERLRTM